MTTIIFAIVWGYITVTLTYSKRK